jgi:hypothetical protein
MRHLAAISSISRWPLKQRKHFDNWAFLALPRVSLIGKPASLLRWRRQYRRAMFFDLDQRGFCWSGSTLRREAGEASQWQ